MRIGPAWKLGTTFLLAFALTGCAGLRSSLDGRVDGREMLHFVDRLNRADAAELDAIGERIEAESGRDAGVRRALWWATPGHEGHAPERARAELQALLRQDNTLDENGHLLLRMQLEYVEERARLLRGRNELVRQNRELRRQIEELTELERRMGEGDDNGE